MSKEASCPVIAPWAKEHNMPQWVRILSNTQLKGHVDSGEASELYEKILKDKISGMTYEGIAAKNNCKVSTVKSAIKYWRRKDE